MNDPKHPASPKIKKLLRLARKGGPEGSLAAVRAEELMKKYRLQITLDEDIIERTLANIVGTFWREHLLVTTATVNRCRVKMRKSAVAVIGEREDVERTVSEYVRFSTEMTGECARSWSTVPAFFRTPETEIVWHRVFHISATISSTWRMQGGAREPGPAPGPHRAVGDTAAPGEDAPPTVDERIAKELEKSKLDFEALVKMVGDVNAQMFQKNAWRIGQVVGEELDLVERKCLMEGVGKAEQTESAKRVAKVETSDVTERVDIEK